MMAGISELVIALIVLGGLGGEDTGKLEAPRDKSKEAIQHVVPDAHVVFHANLEAAMNLGFKLVEEVQALKLVQRIPALRNGSQALDVGIASVLSEVGQKLGLDLRKDIGSLTFSLRFVSKKEIYWFVRVRGNFGNSKLSALLAKEQISAEEHDGVLFRLMPMDGLSETALIGFPDDTTLLVGDPESVLKLAKGDKSKAPKSSPRARLGKALSRKTVNFAYATIPPALLQEMKEETDIRELAEFIDGIEDVLYTAGGGKSRLAVKVKTDAALTTLNYLFKSMASFSSTTESAIDGLAFAVLGIAPLVPSDEIGPEVAYALADEEVVMEAAQWLKKYIAGKVKVKLNKRDKEIAMEMSDVSPVVFLLVPAIPFFLLVSQKSEPYYPGEEKMPDYYEYEYGEPSVWDDEALPPAEWDEPEVYVPSPPDPKADPAGSVKKALDDIFHK